MDASREFDIKVLYGVEGYLLNDKVNIINGFDSKKTYDEYVVFDIETTGLSMKNDKITEIGAVKISNGKIIDRYSQSINPEKKIPEKITELTGITDAMVEDEPLIDSVILDFKEFVGDSVLVAHNANFDIGFIRSEYEKKGYKIENPILDTLELTRSLFPELNRHRLNIIAKHLGVELLNHHRAVDDAEATAEIFLKCLEILKENKIESFDDINKLTDSKDISKDYPSIL